MWSMDLKTLNGLELKFLIKQINFLDKFIFSPLNLHPIFHKHIGGYDLVGL